MSDYNIGAKIKKLRLAKKLTLQSVARETGFSPALISQIENNNVSPPIATLSRIAKFFDVKKRSAVTKSYEPMSARPFQGSSPAPAPARAIPTSPSHFTSRTRRWSRSSFP